MVRILIADYKVSRSDRSIVEAAELLERLKKAAEEGGRMGSVIEILVLQALAYLEVLQLIAQGLSNRAIGERLFVALDTVKGHNRNIFGKLQVQRRTEAVARARELGLL